MDQGIHVPLSLAFEQGSSLRSWSSVRIRSALPFLRPKENPSTFAPVVDSVPAPSNRLIEHYIQWSGGDPHLYPGEVPAHLFSQWSIPLVTRLLSQGRYPLKDIINKGCHVVMHHVIPRGERLYLRADLIDLKETDTQITFSIQVTTSTQTARNAIVAVFHLMLLLEPPTAKPHRKSRPLHSDYNELGHWSVDSRDGFRYALLTGDFNPIHWLDPLAKRSNFGGKVLHGFASLSKTWERIQSPAQHNHNIQDITVQFIQPIHLPTAGLKVLTSGKPNRQGQYKLRVRSENNQLHLLGKYSLAPTD